MAISEAELTQLFPRGGARELEPGREDRLYRLAAARQQDGGAVVVRASTRDVPLIGGREEAVQLTPFGQTPYMVPGAGQKYPPGFRWGRPDAVDEDSRP